MKNKSYLLIKQKRIMQSNVIKKLANQDQGFKRFFANRNSIF